MKKTLLFVACVASLVSLRADCSPEPWNLAEVGKWMAANGEAIYGTRGAGLVKNADGSETAKTVKNGRTFAIAISTNGFPVVTK